MAKSMKKEGLMAKYGSKIKGAVDAHKKDETRQDTGGRLPAGIENGVAKLVECRFDVVKPGKQNEGEWYFRAAGVVVMPKEYAGVRTTIMEMVCDTPDRARKTVEEHVDYIMNEMRKLGYDTSDLEPDGLEDAAKAIEEAQPFFRFRTWVGQKETTGPYAGKEPRINEVWQGAVEFDEDEGEEDVQEDEEEDEEEEEAEEMSLEDLAKKADEDDDAEAQAVLEEAAKAKDMDPEDYGSWTDLVAAMTSENEEEEEEEEPWKPSKNDEVKFKNPKTKKMVEGVVTAVNEKKETCTVKDKAGTQHVGLKWNEVKAV